MSDLNGCCTNFSRCVALTNVVNQLLDSEEKATFRTQAKSVDTNDLASLEAYVIEALSRYSLFFHKILSNLPM